VKDELQAIVLPNRQSGSLEAGYGSMANLLLVNPTVIGFGCAVFASTTPPKA
jgi:hypothetical protein